MRIDEKQKKRIEELAKKFRLKMIVIFGSFANGTEKKDSDIDIGVKIRKKLIYKDEIALMRELSDIFKQDADMSIINYANPLLLNQMAKNSVLVYGKENDYRDFKLYAFHRYNDYMPFFEMEKKLNKKIIHQYANR
jgi:uncharacterized protein